METLTKNGDGNSTTKAPPDSIATTEPMRDLLQADEYVSLRQEVLENQKFVLTAVEFVLAASGLFLGAAIQTREPIIALFPLFVLYLGQRIVFNNAQTEAKISTYLLVFWERKSKDFHWERRQKRYREYVANSEKRKGWIRSFLHWLFGSMLHEEWMATSVQWAFFGIGVVCIVAYVLIWMNLVWNSTNSSASSVWISSKWLFGILLAISALFWVRLLCRLFRQTQTFQGKENLMDVTRDVWDKVRRCEPESLAEELQEEAEEGNQISASQEAVEVLGGA